jgi:hypothetical protein
MNAFVVEFVAKEAHDVVAGDINLAAALAQALAVQKGMRVHAVYSRDEYGRLLQELAKGKMLGKG